MGAKIVSFPSVGGQTTGLAHFVRLADGGARSLGDLVAEGHLLPKRVVVDASRFKRQAALVQDLRLKGVEIVLDTKAAELGTLGRCGRQVQELPWALHTPGEPLGPDHFGHGANTAVIDEIARFAVRNQVDAVLSPSHWLGDPDIEDWLLRDIHSCIALRKALDEEGGRSIAIDFPIIAPHTLLREPKFRRELISTIADTAAENLWFRASGFQNGAAPLTTRRHIEAMASYDELGRPIVADCIGGLTGLALLAFGTVSAISHGIGRHDGFIARDWHKPPRERSKDDDGPKSQNRIWLSELNRTLTKKEVFWLASARGGRRAVSCSDRECCPSGLDDMARDPRRHAARQMMARYRELERVPDLKRPDHFVHQQLERVARKARSVSKLRPDSKGDTEIAAKIDKLMKRMANNADTLEKTRTALEKLIRDESVQLSRAPLLRSRHAQADLFEKEGER